MALLWGWIAQRPALSGCRWNLLHVLVGTVAAVPPFVFFLWSLQSNIVVFTRQRDLLETLLRPLFGRWSVVQLGVISVIAGLAEEALFRGAIQAAWPTVSEWFWRLFWLPWRLELRT